MKPSPWLGAGACCSYYYASPRMLPVFRLSRKAAGSAPPASASRRALRILADILHIVDAGQLREGRHASRHHDKDADASDQHRRNGAEPVGHQASAHIAERIGAADEKEI